MKLAVNYSSALISLLIAHPALPVDYIKVPTVPFPDCWFQFDEGGLYRKLLPHLAQTGILAPGHPEAAQRLNSEIVATVLEKTDPPYLSTHLDAKLEYYPEMADFLHQSSAEFKQLLTGNFLEAIHEIKESIRIPLVLENSTYYPWRQSFRLVVETAFITEICEEGDCGLIVDIAHARCSALNLNQEIAAYFQALPLKRVREIHLSGVLERPEGLRDTHTSPTDFDFELLELLLRITDPQIITIEYGGLPDRIMNPDREYEPLSRNNPHELREIIGKVLALTGIGVL